MLRIGYQGDYGSNNEKAANLFIRSMFSSTNCKTVPLISSTGVMRGLKNKTIDYGVMAVKNTLGGEVRETKEVLSSGSLIVLNSLKIDIIHNICGVSNNINSVRKIISHPQAIIQCRKELVKILPHVKLEDYADTALAAKDVSKLNDKTLACVCNDESSRMYNLKVLKKNILGDLLNQTEFIIVSLS